MGYESTLTGEITIRPAVRWVDYRDSMFREDGDRTLSIRLSESVNKSSNDDGEVLTRTATAIVPRSIDRGVYYNLANELRVLLEQIPAGKHRFDGYLTRKGEEQGDVQRYWIDADGTVQSETADMRWPDGTAVEP
ncbi:MAG TPA: DUF6205 family protein [Actinophytocola sp.]|uniref:DUF6205 family protein n=1 Tax=Actinophytocola sp. TaxID=1872138 RepID=UPI002DB97DCF|nr:DUF6205 family protein [Actinophytocola sp.]HEU5475666.1 DUF6205 family protein [Actinophytocola sp.]